MSIVPPQINSILLFQYIFNEEGILLIFLQTSPSKSRQQYTSFKSPTASVAKDKSKLSQPNLKKYNSLNPTEEKKLVPSNVRSQQQEWGVSKTNTKAVGSWKKPDISTGRNSANQKNNDNKLREEEIEAKRALKSLEQKLTLLKSKIKTTK